MNSIIFLSHIHEEKDLAILFKSCLEDEFGGFVEVFVSSDGVSIPAGSNFLKRIEDGLINCKAGLYLISPYSVNRNWINFELGAVWIRNKLALQINDNEIPIIPLCHSGMKLSDLSQPICNLNAIQANVSGQIKFAFESIQKAVGGKGRLKTDFDALASNIISFERKYTLGENLLKLFSYLTGDMKIIYKEIDVNPNLIYLNLDLGHLDNFTIEQIKILEKSELNGKIKVDIKNPGISFGTQGAINGAHVNLTIETSILKEFRKLLEKN